MLIGSLVASVIFFSGFSINVYLYNSYNLFYVLLGVTILNFVNLVFLKLYKSVSLVSYLYLISILLAFSYFVFDSGRGGYGYIWFCSLPILNISILGIKKGTFLSLIFLVFLLIIFIAVPDYYLADEYFKELKPRILFSMLGLIVFLVFKEWTIEILKQDQAEVNLAQKMNFEVRKQALDKYSSQLNNISNDILSSVSAIKSQIPDQKTLIPLNSINESALNYKKIVNSLSELTSSDLLKDSGAKVYQLKNEIERIVSLFNSYKVSIKVKIDEDIPAKFNNNSFFIRQIVYNTLDSFIQKKADNIEIIVKKEAESEQMLKLSFKIVNVYCEENKIDFFNTDFQTEDLYVIRDDNSQIQREGLSAIIPFLDVQKKRPQIKKTNDFLSLYFNQQINKSDIILDDASYSSGQARGLGENELFKKQLNNMRVLFMDDNPITQKTVLFSLNKITKTIDIADNGKEGLSLFFKNKYDLILLDMNMPIVDGYEVAKRIRNLEQGSKIHIPIIALVSNFLAKDIERVLVSGVDDYIKKPLKINDLLQRINKIYTVEND